MTGDARAIRPSPASINSVNASTTSCTIRANRFCRSPTGDVSTVASGGFRGRGESATPGPLLLLSLSFPAMFLSPRVPVKHGTVHRSSADQGPTCPSAFSLAQRNAYETPVGCNGSVQNNRRRSALQGGQDGWVGDVRGRNIRSTVIFSASGVV